MSVEPDKGSACPKGDTVAVFAEGDPSHEPIEEIKKKNRSVRFPNENQLVTEYFEPANPWHDVPATTRAQLAQEYLLSCRQHNTPPIDSVLQQIRELPENSIGGAARAARLTLADCSLEGAAPADALEALLRKVQFHRLELDHAEVDDEGAEALFDMIEYYESACVICISGPRQFGIRGWQAASRMIKKSAELSEIEVSDGALEPSHAPVLARALRPHTCRLRALCLQRARLSGEALMCLVIALKSNGSVRELRLPDNDLTPHDAQQLASLLRFNNNVQLLDLSNNIIQDMGVGYLADALVEQADQTPPSATSPISPHLYPLSGLDSKGLAFLVLWNNQLTRNCAPHLSKALRSSHSLCVLNVGRNALGAEAVRALGAAVPGGALASLGLQGARLGADAGAPLHDLLRAPATKLQRLDLRDNRLGVVALQALLDAMKENHTLTQMDLDDPVESATLSVEDSTAAVVARLTRDIRALCRRNEPPPERGERRVLRKISLTCASHQHHKISPLSSSSRHRLRSPLPSPAPSPAGSPLPHHQQNTPNNRFSVTRVTPERDSSAESSSPTTPPRAYCGTPSRFKVMQVAEPPSIQVQPANKRTSRFSVTRNYDSIYNPSPRESPSASPTPNSPSPSVSPCPSDASLASYSDSPRSEDILVPKVLSVSDSPKSDVKVTYSDSEERGKYLSVKVKTVESDKQELVQSLQSSNDNVKVRIPNVSISQSDSNPGIAMDLGIPNVIMDDSTKSIKGTKASDGSVGSGTIDTDSCLDSVEKCSIDFVKETPMLYTSSVDRLYNYPSITTLSGALYNRSVAELSTTTLCPAITEQKSSDSISISIASSRSDSIFGPGLSIETTAPTAVPNSRFSISPSPVSYMSFDYVKPTSIRNVASNSDTRSETNISKSEQTQIVSTGNKEIMEKDVPSITGERTKEIGIETTEMVKRKSNKTAITEQKVLDTAKMSVATTSHKDVIEQDKDNDVKNDEKCVPVVTNVQEVRNDSIVRGIIESKGQDTVSIEKDCVKEVKLTKAVDFASKPEDVIFFISDEPISCSKVKCDATNSKTYSDAVKCELFNDETEQLTYEQQIDDETIKTETKLVKNSVKINESEKTDVQVQVLVKTESVLDNTAKVHSDKDFVNIDDILVKKDDKALKKIEAITEDLGNLIQEMKDMSVKKKCTVDIDSVTNIVPASFNRDVVLKKNKSESSLDSPDLEVSRLMNKKMACSPFRDSSSSLEISGSSMESLNAIENAPKKTIKTELDRRKESVVLSTESSVESTSEVTPVNSQNFLNTSVSSNDSVSPIFQTKKIHGSLSSLEASVSSLDSKQMVTSADSGIEHSLQHHSEGKDDVSSNEGTLTQNSSLRDTMKHTQSLQETLTSPKRASSLLDVPTLKNKGLDRMRKISWVAPSPSFHIPRVEPEKAKEEKPSHLEKLLSLFQNPTSIFSRSQSDDERKSASNTPPRKDSSLTSSFWSWGSAIDYKEEKDDSSEATDSTLSERVQVSFVDESFSKKLDSKTPSTDTDNTLSEFQSVVTETTDVLVQKIDLSDNAGSDNILDLSRPNENVNENETTKTELEDKTKLDEVKPEAVRPRSFASVLKDSGSENSLEKQPSPDAGQLVDKLPVKVIRGIKENISPENTLTASMSNTNTLAIEMINQPVVNVLWEVPIPVIEKNVAKSEEYKSDMAPIATIDETSDLAADNFSSEPIQLAYIDDLKVDDVDERIQSASDTDIVTVTKELENVDLGKDALSYLMYENQDFEPDVEHTVATKIEGSLAQELKEAEIKEMIDMSPELVIDEAIEVFPVKEVMPVSSPIIPDRAKLKKSNSLEDLSQRQDKEKSTKTKTIVFKVPETSPCDIPERRSKLRSRSGSSPKSLPESLNKPCPLSKMETILSKKKKRVSSLGKMARDSLLALNMSEDEIAEFRRSYKLTSVESLRSLESVSEDANSQSGTSIDSRCRACLRTSQESLMSLDSITEDCKCPDRDKPRSMR